MRISVWSSDVCSSDLPDQLRLRNDRDLEGGRVGQVDEAEVQPGAASAHALEQAVGAAVQVVHGDHVVAAVEQLQRGRGRRHARGECEAAAAALQPGHATLVGEAGGVVGARVDRKSHTSELQSLMRISYAVFCLKKKKTMT